MSYRISYERGTGERASLWEIPISRLIGCVMLVIAIIFRLFQPGVVESVREQLLPEAKEVMAWMDDFALSNTVQAFCQDILHAK